MEILGEEVIFQKGSFCRVRRWFRIEQDPAKRSVNPQNGLIIWGFTGWESVQEFDVFRPILKFHIQEHAPFELRNVA